MYLTEHGNVLNILDAYKSTSINCKYLSPCSMNAYLLDSAFQGHKTVLLLRDNLTNCVCYGYVLLNSVMNVTT